MAPDPAIPSSQAHAASARIGEAARIRESETGTEQVRLFRQPEWVVQFPWLFQATTGRSPVEVFDLSFFSSSPAATVWLRWRAVRDLTGFQSVAHARQVHGSTILVHGSLAAGILLADAADGHLTQVPGVLLAVSVADCVPVFLVHPAPRVITLLHAGWRSIAAGILERGVERICQDAGPDPSQLHCHFGPAICGQCYEVGPEVHEALGLARPDRNQPIDLRSALTRRALGLKIPAGQISVSAFCTRCDSKHFFSHRGGSPERQMALLGIRP
ncbi:MAG TPA: polyphenol oxidase family protein [Longimicrobiales bacterium]|nr:polyphenol oxidase family protein [Longimicrobiales bacterium]